MINVVAMILLVTPMIFVAVTCVVLAMRAKRDEGRTGPRLKPGE